MQDYVGCITKYHNFEGNPCKVEFNGCGKYGIEIIYHMEYYSHLNVGYEKRRCW